MIQRRQTREEVGEEERERKKDKKHLFAPLCMTRKKGKMLFRIRTTYIIISFPVATYFAILDGSSAKNESSFWCAVKLAEIGKKKSSGKGAEMKCECRENEKGGKVSVCGAKKNPAER